MAEALEADFGGEERRFLLLLGGIRKVEEKTGQASGSILHALARVVTIQKAYPNATLLEQSAIGFGDLRVDYVREPVLQGLIDGGLNPNESAKLVRTWIDERGFQGVIENAWLAWMVLGLGWKRPEIDAGESKAETQTATASPPDSTSPTSTAPEPPSDGPRPKSMRRGSGSSPPPSKAGRPKAAKATRASRQAPPNTTP